MTEPIAIGFYLEIFTMTRYELRRKNRQISNKAEMLRILDAAEFGVLSLVDSEGIPYGFPINFARKDDILVFHCAPEGRKLECIRCQPRVSFCVVGRTNLLPSQFSTEYESVVVEGVAEIISDEDRKIEDLMILCRKLAPENLDAAEEYIQKSLHRTGIFEIRIKSMTGKAKRLASQESDL